MQVIRGHREHHGWPAVFGGKVRRFSHLERAIPNITQKMLGQQLRRMESDGIVVRKAYPEVPPRVELQSHGVGPSAVPGAGCDFEVGRPQEKYVNISACGGLCVNTLCCAGARTSVSKAVQHLSEGLGMVSYSYFPRPL